MPVTKPLDPIEARVIGALLEKELTTPEYYPLTLRALVAACNQRSARDPVTDYAEHTVAEALDRLRQEALAWRSEGARTERWQHLLDRRWGLDGATKAVMTLLLLRGPQTPGELRTRSDRLHGFASVAEVEAALHGLAAREDPMVRELSRRPGQRESRWVHLVGDAPIVDDGPAAAGDVEAARPSRGSELTSRVEKLEGEVAALKSELAALREALGA